MSKDQLFSEPYSEIKAFAFDEKVVSVFPDMIKRSVPGYETILKGIAMLAMKYVKPHTHVYDLGSSLGGVSLTVDQAIGSQRNIIHAIDNSEAMINQFKANLNGLQINNEIIPLLQDITTTDFLNSSFTVSNFTLQFMAKEHRDLVCQNVYQSLNQGGVFILSEKVTSSDLLIDYYHGYKKVNGYSDMEIAQKRQALEDALKPDDLETWIHRLNSVGFKKIEVWFRAFNFISLVAIK